jgi:hypothetical protein
VAVQWREGFRLDPNARWDDEIKRLSETADAFERVADVVQSTLSEPCSPLESLSRLQVLIDPPPRAEEMADVLATLVGAIAWNFHHLVLRTAHLVFADSHRRPGRCSYHFSQHGSLDDRRGRQGDRAHGLVAIR